MDTFDQSDLMNSSLASTSTVAPLRIVGISGSLSSGSKTKVLAETVVAAIGGQTGAAIQMVDVGELAPHLGIRSRQEASPAIETALHAIETADLLIAASPIYQGSYSGLFKHLIDLVDYKALQGKPVGLVATGGSDRHALAVEYQLRPLFTSFLAHTLPTAVFVAERAWSDGRIEDAATQARLDKLIEEAAQALRSHSAGIGASSA
jgi:FMN reductase